MSLLLLLFLGIGVILCQRIVNKSYKRSVYFTGTVVREEHLIEISVADESPKPSAQVPADLTAELHENWFPNYVFLVSPDQAKKVTSWSANLIVNPSDSSTQTISINDITSEVVACQKHGYRCLNVILPMDGSKLDQKLYIAISLAFIDELKPKPAVVVDAITAPVRLFYHSESLDPISAYETESSQTVYLLTSTSKSLRLKCPVGRKPEKLTGVPLPMDMKGFICSGTSENGPVEFHFESKDATMVRIRKLHRKFTYLPWINEVQVKESFEYVHEGPQPPESPSFLRMKFSRVMFMKKGNIEGLQVVPRVLIVVPKGARSLQVRDEVGIIWSERERRKVEEDLDAVQVPLRFPMIGGMSIEFDFYYTMNADDLIKPFKASSSPFKNLIQMPMFRTVLDVPVDDFKLTFVLPEDSGDIEYEMASSKPAKVLQRTFRTYFSTIGEKEISFEFKQMTREELEKGIAILFNYPFWAVFRKPMVIFSSLVFLILAVLYLNRIDLNLRISSNKKNKALNKKKIAEDSKRILSKFFDKRREILMNFEDLFAGNLNARASLKEKQNDLILKDQMDEQLKNIQNAIFEKIKSNCDSCADPQQTSMNAMALKRLYDDQESVCQKIFGIVSGFDDNEDEDATDDVDDFSANESRSRAFGSSASLNSKLMSRSESGDLMSQSKSNRTIIIDAYAKDALKIDSQVLLYEGKFLK